jgi:hypothetical protein
MNERAAIFDACRELTGAIYNGLDVARKLTLSLIKTSATQFFFEWQ